MHEPSAVIYFPTLNEASGPMRIVVAETVEQIAGLFSADEFPVQVTIGSDYDDKADTFGRWQTGLVNPDAMAFVAPYGDA